MSEDFTVSVKFNGHFNDRIDGVYNHCGGYINLPGSGFTYGTLSKVKAKAKAQAQSFVGAAIRNAENRERLLIACKDGHIIVVSFDEGWGYSIANEDRQHQYAGSCTVAGDFKNVCEMARKHAEQCFGGVAWENRL